MTAILGQPAPFLILSPGNRGTSALPQTLPFLFHTHPSSFVTAISTD